MCRKISFNNKKVIFIVKDKNVIANFFKPEKITLDRPMEFYGFSNIYLA